MYCLDTYALIEIAIGNPKFAFLMKEQYVIPNTTLGEFCWVLIKEDNEHVADLWTSKLKNRSVLVSTETILKAQFFREKNKKKNLSFFDCAGYQFALDKKYEFVTGDKEFKNLPGVKFIPK
tara:strand:+ start:2828 stop:3190 length:363 start_codon:yes stop_codon:yes gene_type:complete